MTNDKLISKIKKVLKGKTIGKVGSDLLCIMPDKKHLTLSRCDYENKRGKKELEKYLKDMIN